MLNSYVLPPHCQSINPNPNQIESNHSISCGWCRARDDCGGSGGGRGGSRTGSCCCCCLRRVGHLGLVGVLVVVVKVLVVRELGRLLGLVQAAVFGHLDWRLFSSGRGGCRRCRRTRTEIDILVRVCDRRESRREACRRQVGQIGRVVGERSHVGACHMRHRVVGREAVVPTGHAATATRPRGQLLASVWIYRRLMWHLTTRSRTTNN